MATETATESARDIHLWFGLSYANYLVLPRTLLQSMPELWRKYGKDGKRRWPYCAEHMFGRWLENGLVMCWILKADDDG